MTNSTQENITSNCGVFSGSFESFDPEELLEVVPKSHLEHSQLVEGHFEGDWLQASLGQSVLATANYNLPMLVRGLFPDDKVTISFNMGASGITNVNGKKHLPHELVLWSKNYESYIRLAPNIRWCVFEISLEQLESLGVCVEDNQSQIYQLSPQSQIRVKAAFTDAINLLLQIQHQSGEIIDCVGAYRGIQDFLTSTLSRELQALQSTAKPNKQNSGFQRYNLIRKAESFIDTNENEPIGIVQLCESLHTSLRRLELAFRDIHGMSPKKFITMRKLTAVRRELLNSAPDECTVSKVAMRHGFFHMGRFAYNYKKFFGESPSTTLFSSTFSRLAHISDILNRH